MTITAEALFAAIQQANEEMPSMDNAWINDEFGLGNVRIDGGLNLERVAELLSE